MFEIETPGGNAETSNRNAEPPGSPGRHCAISHEGFRAELLQGRDDLDVYMQTFYR